MQDWPTTVPMRALLGSYAESQVDNVAEFQPEVGPPKRRRRTSISMSNIQFELILTTEQASGLAAFYRNTLADGTLEFMCPHPRDCSTTVVCVFASPPSFSDFVPGKRRVGIQLVKIY